MKLIEFPEQTVIIAKNQKEYLPLPAFQVNDLCGTIVCKWKLSWTERFKLLFTGVVWHNILTFGQPVQPMKLQINKPDMTQKVYPQDIGSYDLV